MNKQENFLARWLRLKQESSAVTEPDTTELASVQSTTDEIPSGEEGMELPPQETSMPAPATFDPATLPPIDSITMDSDIRQFLQSGVPAELVRAALRSAWVADPAIRDFIGIAENQWDFNDPTAIPGFGPLEAGDEAGSLMARLVSRPDNEPNALERIAELAEQSSPQSVTPPFEGQVDKVWLSSSTAEANPSGADIDQRAGDEGRGDGDGVRESGSATDGRREFRRVHGSALPKAG